MAMQEKEKKKKRVVSLACSFCKKRHYKCDGTHPCAQCVSRNEECVFELNKKRGRKAALDLQVMIKILEIKSAACQYTSTNQ